MRYPDSFLKLSIIQIVRIEEHESLEIAEKDEQALQDVTSKKEMKTSELTLEMVSVLLLPNEWRR
jgi:hypothetical protein